MIFMDNHYFIEITLFLMILFFTSEILKFESSVLAVILESEEANVKSEIM